jgi:serine/threonine-protein kinase
MEVMMAHVRDVVTPPKALRSEIPADLENIILRCLSKNPQDRYPDTLSLAEDLDRCADAANWSPRHAALWWQAHQAEIRDIPPAREARGHASPTPATALVADNHDRAVLDRLA